MEIFLLILFGFISGILGGMGMGGGTLLIPLLGFLDIRQQTIQAINLISFLPMAVIVLVMHFKNGLVKPEKMEWIIIPAVIFSAFGAYLTKSVQPGILKICFGVFLLGLGIWQMVLGIKKAKQEKKEGEKGEKM